MLLQQPLRIKVVAVIGILSGWDNIVTGRMSSENQLFTNEGIICLAISLCSLLFWDKRWFRFSALFFSSIGMVFFLSMVGDFVTARYQQGFYLMGIIVQIPLLVMCIFFIFNFTGVRYQNLIKNKQGSA